MAGFRLIDRPLTNLPFPASLSVSCEQPNLNSDLKLNHRLKIDHDLKALGWKQTKETFFSEQQKHELKIKPKINIAHISLVLLPGPMLNKAFEDFRVQEVKSSPSSIHDFKMNNLRSVTD